MRIRSGILFFLFFLSFFTGRSQDSSAVTWEVHAVKSSYGGYTLIFNAHVKPGWQLYAPNQDLSGTNSMELSFADSSFSAKSSFQTDGKTEKHSVALFDNASFVLFPTDAKISVPLSIRGTVPARLFGALSYYYGKEDSFYSGNFAFNTSL